MLSRHHRRCTTNNNSNKNHAHCRDSDTSVARRAAGLPQSQQLPSDRCRSLRMVGRRVGSNAFVLPQPYQHTCINTHNRDSATSAAEHAAGQQRSRRHPPRPCRWLRPVDQQVATTTSNITSNTGSQTTAALTQQIQRRQLLDMLHSSGDPDSTLRANHVIYNRSINRPPELRMRNHSNVDTNEEKNCTHFPISKTLTV